MVAVVAYVRGDSRTLNLYEFANGTAVYSNQTSTSYTIDYSVDGVAKRSFITGFGFQYAPSGAPVAGTTTGATNYIGTRLFATFDDLAITTAQAAAYIQWNDPQRVNADVFRGADTIIGSLGNDYLDGYGGADTLRGRTGDDTYVVDNAGDRIVENANEGLDRVLASVTYRLGANVENLTQAGTASINATGNDLDNVLTGNSGDNRLNGLAGNDTLRGGNGNDTLDGGLGADRLEGGKGNDTLVVENSGDVVIELAGQGTDRVRTTVSYTLTSGQEIEIFQANDLASTTPLDLTGNEFGQRIYGNAGANTIRGGGGNDFIYGGSGSDDLYGDAGNDTFVFQAVSDSPRGGQDAIRDFRTGDRIDLSDIATGASNGHFNLAAGATTFSGTAGELVTTFRADTSTATVYGDVNGDRVADLVISVLTEGRALQASDFILT